MSVDQLTLKQLRAFAAVYRAGQLSAAARDLNVTQSAVSVLIKQIETVLGVQLFDRTTRRLTPTEAGENTIGLVQRILGDINALDQSLRDIRELDRGTVRLTATPATAMSVLPGTVRRFRQSYPAIGLVVDDCAPNQFLANIRAEKADFGVGVPPQDGEFDTRLIVEDILCAILPDDHPLASERSLRWSALKDEPLILSRREYGIRNLAEVTLQNLGIQPRLGAEVGFLSTATWLAGSGIGICILPERLARLFPVAGLSVIPLTDPDVTRPLSVVTRKSRSLSPASRRFVEMLIEDGRRCC